MIREAVKTALADFRRNPDLIDDVLEELRADSLTKDTYGDKTIDACRKWFSSSKVTVKLGLDISQGELPCIAISLSPSAEAESTIGDLDANGTLEVHPTDPTRSRRRYGVEVTETYTIGCFVHGEPEYVLFLYSLMMYGLLRVKFRLLDQRGFFATNIQSGALIRDSSSEAENIYSRSINITGRVRHSWADDWQGPVTEIDVNATPMGTPRTDFDALQETDILLGY